MQDATDIMGRVNLMTYYDVTLSTYEVSSSIFAFLQAMIKVHFMCLIGVGQIDFFDDFIQIFLYCGF